MIDVQDLKDKINIVDVIGQYADLEKVNGSSYRARCPHPHHDDKNPSFYVKEDDQYFICFSCSFKGDVVSFIEEIEGIDFLDAVNLLIDTNNINVKEKTSYTLERDLSVEDIQNAIKLYKEQNVLSENILDEYIYQPHRILLERGYDEKILELFEIGFCPYQSNEMYNRITIPWRNEQGELIAINGRDVTGKSDKKYKFKKGGNKSSFYNINRITPSKKPLLILEGELDVIKAYQLGYKKVIGIGGISLKDDKWLLRKYAPSVILGLDQDTAGLEGRKKIAKGLYPLMDVYAINLDIYNDIGEINDSEVLEEMINNKVRYKGGK